MANHSERFKVRHLGRTLTVYPYTRPADGVPSWRFGYKDANGRTRYITRMTREEAELAALAKLEDLQPGGLDWSTLPGQEREFLEELHRLDLSAEDREAVLRFAAERAGIRAKLASFEAEIRELRSRSKDASPDSSTH